LRVLHSSLLTLLLFFLCSGDHRYLHSFPTRRSSDLKALVQRALRQSGIDQPCEFEWSPFSRFPKSYSAHRYRRDKQPQGYFRPRDRKSTRLNSSHVEISYAVFCLKKKKKERERKPET